MIRLFLFQVFKHQIHRILEILIILTDLHGIDKFDERGKVLFLLRCLIMDVADESTMDKNKSVADFMNSFLNTPEPKIDNEYYEIEEQYFRQFGHGVPREMLPDSISTEQIKQAMKKCILSKKDNLFELLGIIINDNYLY